MNNKNQQKGFTILIAVVAASILLVIAMAIGDIALKEKVLTASGKDSQIAFYAADTGIECALYWDQKQGVFSARDLNNSNSNTNAVPSALFKCNGSTITDVKDPDTLATLSQIPGGEKPVMFTVTNLSSNNACAIVVIRKRLGQPVNPVSGVTYNPTKIYTTVDSRGYNTCSPSLRRLERGILATYW
jgi:hypothetical protein